MNNNITTQIYPWLLQVWQIWAWILWRYNEFPQLSCGIFSLRNGGNLNMYFCAVQKRCEFTVGAFSNYKCQTQVEFPTKASHLQRSLSVIAPVKMTHREIESVLLLIPLFDHFPAFHFPPIIYQHTPTFHSKNLVLKLRGHYGANISKACAR